jgi:hypothetical protein
VNLDTNNHATTTTLRSHNTTKSIPQVGAHELKFSSACTLIVFNKKQIIKKTLGEVSAHAPKYHLHCLQNIQSVERVVADGDGRRS